MLPAVLSATGQLWQRLHRGMELHNLGKSTDDCYHPL